MKALCFRSSLQKRLEPNFEPAWKDQVERWYQLDELGFAFCEAIHEWEYLKAFPKPDLILLALEEASNPADKDYVLTGGQSPAKFVYTLPNISAAIIFQMLKINGKVYCLSHGKNTLTVAHEEAKAFAQSGKVVWVLASPSRAKQDVTRDILFYCF